MSSLRFYLDANVYVRLFEPSQDRVRAALIGGVRTSGIQVYASSELLEELVVLAEAMAPRGPTLLDMSWAVIGDRVLRERHELLPAELRKGARLSLRESLLPLEMVRAIRSRTYDPSRRLESAIDVQSARNTGAAKFEALVEHAQRHLEAECGSRSKARREAWRHRITDVFLEDYASELFSAWPDIRGERVSQWRRLSQLPFSKAFISIATARIRHLHESMARVDNNDRHDEIHYTLASIPGTLVTDDRKLHRWSAQIENPVVKVLDYDEFANPIQAVATSSR